jgi:hypothetical protein
LSSLAARSSSGPPTLAAKLGLRPGLRITVFHLPPPVRASLRSTLARCVVSSKRPREAECVLLFASERTRADSRLSGILQELAPAGALWICWPKRSSGIATDLSDEAVRALGLAAGLVDVKVCSIDASWSGLKFVRRLRDRSVPRLPARGPRAPGR